MKDFSNKYIFVFSVVMVTIVAALLSTTAMVLQPKQEKNREIEKKRNILASVRIEADRTNAAELFDKTIKKSLVINTKGEEVVSVDPFTIDLRSEQKKKPELQNLPLFIAGIDGDKELVIIPLEGKGLWGPIYGYISLEADMSTVYGVTFDHKGETPGLGAEINTSAFEDMFVGKKIFESDKFVSVKVVKGGAPDGDIHGVDAISGGTITSVGLEDMLFDCLIKYKDYLIKNRL
jgi:Na+-transporting NADH:ubiquinone oxidoreductase subunit C